MDKRDVVDGVERIEHGRCGMGVVNDGDEE